MPFVEVAMNTDYVVVGQISKTKTRGWISKDLQPYAVFPDWDKSKFYVQSVFQRCCVDPRACPKHLYPQSDFESVEHFSPEGYLLTTPVSKRHFNADPIRIHFGWYRDYVAKQIPEEESPDYVFPAALLLDLKKRLLEPYIDIVQTEVHPSIDVASAIVQFVF